MLIKKFFHFFFPLLILFFITGYVFATQRVRPPKDVTVIESSQGPKISWDYSQPDTIFSFNNGFPGGIWQLTEKAGLGVIFDLSDYPDATLEEIDFVHYAKQNLYGPYYFRVHVYDMDSLKEVATIDSLVAGDAYEMPRYETYVSLGSLPYIPHVGIFIQGLSTVDTVDYYYPSVMTDTSPYVPGVSYMCINFDDPFNSSDPNYLNIYELNVVESQATNVLIDLWINFGANKKVRVSNNSFFAPKPGAPYNLPQSSFQLFKSPSKTVQNTIAQKGFYIFKGINGDSLEKIDEVPFDVWEYIDSESTMGDSVIYGVNAFSDTLLSEIMAVPYNNTVISIAAARQDTNWDFVPDRLSDTVEVRGMINSVNFGIGTHYFLQDYSGGIYLNSDDFAVDLKIKDSIYVKGVIQQIDGLTAIVPLSMESIVVLDSVHQIPVLTLDDVEHPENAEGMLLSVGNLHLLNPEDWPALGNSGTVSATNDADTFDIYISPFSELDGWSAPNEFNLVAVVDQYTQKSPPDDGYRLRPSLKSDFTPIAGLEDGTEGIPLSFSLDQNFPNPFNPVTFITYHLPKTSKVQVEVYNLLGQKIETLVHTLQPAGTYTVQFNGAGRASGIYLYKISAGSFSAVRKMILLK